jgi:hypothetical protein
MKNLARTNKDLYKITLSAGIPYRLKHGLNCERPLTSLWNDGSGTMSDITGTVSITEDATDKNNYIDLTSAGGLTDVYVRVIAV